MLKKVAKRRIYDTLHKTGVFVCMGLSAACLFDLGYLGFDYFFRIRPARRAEALRIQQELLQEGSPDSPQNLAA